MKSTKHFLFASLALVLLVSCVAVGPANAQGLSGKFTLPFTANWGGVTLPAGEYSFDMDRPSSLLYISRGTKTLGLVMPQTIDWHYPGKSALVVVENAGGNAIRELRLGGSGVVLRYAPAKQTPKAPLQFTMLLPITR